MKPPRRLKRGDIGRCDLIEWAVSVGALVVVLADQPVAFAGTCAPPVAPDSAAKATPKASLEVNLAIVPLRIRNINTAVLDYRILEYFLRLLNPTSAA